MVNLRFHNAVLDVVTSARDMVYHHKVTGEELILKSVPGWYIKFDDVDKEMYTENKPKCLGPETFIYTPYMELIDTLYGEWCITDNCVWGIPLPLFKATDPKKFKKLTQGYLLNKEIVENFANLVGEHGSDIYWSWNLVDLLPEHYRPLAQYLQKQTLVLDRHFIAPKRADLIIEGVDQNEAFLFGS